MAILIARSRIAPGTQLESPAFPIAGLVEFRVRLDPNVIDFNDPALQITVSVLLSFDGGTGWEHETTANIVGGARGKDGNFPSVGVALLSGPGGGEVAFPSGALAKVRYTHNLSKRIGLVSESR